MREISLLEMLQKGVHFGHQESRWNPKMKPYIFSSRNGVHILNLESTRDKLTEAVKFLEATVQAGGTILFVGTKRQVKAIVHKHAEASGMPFMSERWIGGTLTNFSTIHELIKKLRRLKSEQAAGLLDRYTKKEQVGIQKEITKLQNEIGGVEMLDKIPQALIVVDAAKERTAIREARAMKVPIVALCDSNTNPDLVQYPIPANDDATKSVDYIVGFLAEAILAGKQRQAVTAPAPATPAPVPTPAT